MDDLGNPGVGINAPIAGCRREHGQRAREKPRSRRREVSQIQGPGRTGAQVGSFSPHYGMAHRIPLSPPRQVSFEGWRCAVVPQLHGLTHPKVARPSWRPR